MTDLASLLQGGNAWLFAPSAILLGALHGLEPGHSKTMIAAFIVSVRGTIMQAVLLGLAATISHTAIVWAIALAAMYFGSQWNSDRLEPYLQLVSAILIIAVALWMLRRTWLDQHYHNHHHHGHHSHDHAHAHAHAHSHDHSHASSNPTTSDYADAHERAHAEAIKRRFTGQHVTTGQSIAFGLTGGLIPCPAAITVLLLCLQLKKVALGVTLVLCFSIGLAITMVAVGVAAALSLNQVSKRWSGFETLARRAPYLSAGLIVLIGLYTGYLGYTGLRHHS